MDSIFKKDSWDIKKESIPSKNFDVKGLVNENKYLSVTKFTYLKPIFFDEEVRIDIELNGSVYLELNDAKYNINTDFLEKKCLVVDNGIYSCDNQEGSINLDVSNTLKLVVNENTLVKRFTIVQNMKINNCNPNN
jgi:hypothetical protein